MKRKQPVVLLAGKPQKKAYVHVMAPKKLGPPKRAYGGSMVPLRTGGYTPNQSEKKVNDINTATYQVNTTGVFTLLANPILGSDMNNRIGRKIILKSFYIRGRVLTEASTNITTTQQVSSQMARFIVFADLQPNGAAPAVTDLLVEALPSSQLNLNNRDRFVVYCDKHYVFDPFRQTFAANDSFGGQTNQVKLVKKFKRIRLESIYNATNGGTIADINSGALYMFWIGSIAAGTSDINAIVSTRVRYMDA